MSSHSQVEASLDEIEFALANVGKALKASQADDLQKSSAELRDAALRFVQILELHREQALAPAVAVRVRTVAARLGSQRDALARLSAQVDRQLATVLPDQAPSSTYEPRTAGRGAGMARIYKSAG